MNRVYDLQLLDKKTVRVNLVVSLVVSSHAIYMISKLCFW